MAHREGYIKFRCHWRKAKPFSSQKLKTLIHWRQKFYKLGLIGVYKNGIGFGNLSIRISRSKRFLITGSQTGGVTRLNPKHFTEVTRYSFGKNELNCRGPLQASSESLTHAAVYQTHLKAKAVIHVHSLKLWKRFLGVLPTTSKRAAFGTPALAREVMRLLKKEKVRRKKIIILGGHREGLLIFGRSLDEAGEVLVKTLAFKKDKR